MVKLTRHTVPFHTSVKKRLLHITDVHVGWSTPESLLASVERIAHAVRPDAVVLTGDYVNASLKHLDRVRRFVARLPGPKIATLGNHDHWSGAGGIVDALLDEGVTVLMNENVRISDITFAGVDDPRTRHDDVDATLAGRDPKSAVVLCHCPSAARRIAAHGAPLILSGHTHGGQVAVPMVTKAIARAVGLEHTRGWYDVDGARLYVNAGVGHSRKGMRYGREAKAEVALLELLPREVFMEREASDRPAPDRGL